jgi:hypothetical protein
MAEPEAEIELCDGGAEHARDQRGDHHPQPHIDAELGQRDRLR